MTPDLTQPLLGISIVLLAGIIGGELVGKINLPKVTGWIGTGILLRWAMIEGLTPGDQLDRFLPLMHFVLGYIAFTVGAALHFRSLRNARQRLGLIVLGELLITPTIVFVALYFVARLPLDQVLLLSTISIAGAPGTSVLVSQESRAKGILTRTMVAAVALIDMVAVGMFIFAAEWLANGQSGISQALISVGREFGLATLVGAAATGLAIALVRWVVGPAFLGPTFVFVILFSWGMAAGLKVSGILACTIAGIVVTNFQHDTVRAAEAYLRQLGTVLFAAFFTLAGMRLELAQVVPMFGAVAVLVSSRIAGKYISAFSALQLARVPKPVRDNFAFTLIPQGGVGVGLILLVGEFFRDQPELVSAVTAIGLAGLAINQLVGPSAARVAFQRSGEAGKDRARLLDFLDENHITVDLSGNNKEEIVRQLAEQLYKFSPNMPLSQDEFVDKVLKRESLETSCLGKGLMIPHTVVEDGKEITGVLGISSQGLHLGAPDGRPVHAILLLATPETDRTRHLEVLAAFASAITHDLNLREQLYHARSPAHAYNVLHADEAEDLNYFLEDAIERAGVAADR